MLFVQELNIKDRGSTINTAGRIHSLCNSYHKSLLASKPFSDYRGFNPQFTSESLGMVNLKGRQEPVELMSAEMIKK